MVNQCQKHLSLWGICYSLLFGVNRRRIGLLATQSTLQEIIIKKFHHSSLGHFTKKPIPGNGNWETLFCTKGITKIQNTFDPKKSFLLSFLIAQTQQAAVQTAISQIPVRNFPSGSHLLLWWIEAAELWSVRAEKFWFFLSCIRSCPTVTVCVKYWWQLSAVAGGHTAIVGVLVIWMTTCYITYPCSYKSSNTTLWRLQLSSHAVFAVVLLCCTSQRITCQLKTVWVVLFCIFLPIFSWWNPGFCGRRYCFHYLFWHSSYSFSG